ncbi:MAG: hypothetical protein ACYCXY_13760 [Acidimicrobiales bacterium]
MDPDEVLSKARQAVAEVVAAGDCGSSAAADLLDAFESLDHWMTAGGFAPAAWVGAVSRDDTEMVGAHLSGAEAAELAARIQGVGVHFGVGVDSPVPIAGHEAAIRSDIARALELASIVQSDCERADRTGGRRVGSQPTACGAEAS